MSIDILVRIEKKKNGIKLTEFGMSTAHEEKIGLYKTTEEALKVLEDIQETEGNYWEGVLIEGFN